MTGMPILGTAVAMFPKISPRGGLHAIATRGHVVQKIRQAQRGDMRRVDTCRPSGT